MRAAALAPLAGFRERSGLANPVGLDGPALEAALLPLVQAGKLWEATAQVLEDPGVAFRVPVGPVAPPLSRRAAGAATLGEGLRAAALASGDYCAGQRMWLESGDGVVRVCRRFSREVQRGRRQANDFALRMLIDLVRRVAGPRWLPLELRLEGPPPPHAEELAGLCAGAVHFRASAEVVALPRDLLALPLGGPRPAAPGSELPQGDFEQSVQLTVRLLLELGELSLTSLAEAAGTSVRTLQRRLGQVGLRYAELVEGARFEAAMRRLREPGARIIDVAADLGYSDSANFTRAFRRWAGTPPIAFQRAAGAK